MQKYSFLSMIMIDRSIDQQFYVCYANMLIEKGYANDTYDDTWIYLTDDCLEKGNCAFNPYRLLWIREANPDNSFSAVVQDGFLAATFFIGTVATFGLVISWLYMITAWASESQFEKWLKWLKYSLIGIGLVIFSYSAIRLVEYLAKWG